MSRTLLLPVRFVAVAMLLVVMAAGDSQAQTAESLPPREHITVGVVGMAVLEPWFVPAARVSLPLGRNCSLDLDAARVLEPDEYSRPGAAFAGQLRFMGERKPDGSGRYWFAGVMYVRHETLRGGVVTDRGPLVGPRGGYGWDQVFRNGLRVSVEVGGQVAHLWRPFASLAVQWGR